MAGTLGAKARRLELARGISRGGVRSSTKCVGLVWTDHSGAIDLDTLGPGELVVTDYTIDHYAPPAPALAVARDRVTQDAEEHGKVYAWDGSLIGRVLRSSRGGVILEFAWPEGLAVMAGGAASMPGDAAAAGQSSPPRPGSV